MRMEKGRLCLCISQQKTGQHRPLPHRCPVLSVCFSLAQLESALETVLADSESMGLSHYSVEPVSVKASGVSGSLLSVGSQL